MGPWQVLSHIILSTARVREQGNHKELQFPGDGQNKAVTTVESKEMKARGAARTWKQRVILRR